ncbi:hypothetical protein ACWD4P_07835 [Kitasatospora sp. NPDC002543]
MPSWFVVSKQDRALAPDLERFESRRAKSRTVEIDSSHVPMMSHPDVVARRIRGADRPDVRPADRRAARPGGRAGRPDGAGPAGTGRRGRLRRRPARARYPAGPSPRCARVVRHRPQERATEADTVASVRESAADEGS